MIVDIFKDQFAKAAAQAFRNSYPQLAESNGQTGLFAAEEILAGLERPKDPKLGSFAFPIFRYLPALKAKPSDVTSKVASEANRILEAESLPPVVRVAGVGGYLNATIDTIALAGLVLGRVLTEKNEYGHSEEGRGRTNLVEYSSPNIAKPFGVGHLRTTIIGNSLRRIYKKLGYTVVGINYPGDWGTQFGKVIVAFRKWGGPETLQGDAVKHLLQLYVRFHEEVEQDKSLDDEARRAFKDLEEGDAATVELWEQFKRISYEEFHRIYTMLGVEFDLVIGESFFNDKMDAAVTRLTQDGLTSMSQGALVVDLHDPQLPPALLRRQDGATLYLTRDLAGLIWRWQTYHFNESLYVVGSEQADHFRQALKVIEMMEEVENLPPSERMTGRVKHVEFGWIKFGEKTLSTRRGNIIFLEDVLNQAVDLAKEKIREKNPKLQDMDAIAHMIGVGAVIFAQLSVRRHKDVNFIWEDVLNFEGETGPYLQYTHARLCSLERMYGQPIDSGADLALLNAEEERMVIETLADFEAAIHEAARNNDPWHIATYLLRLTGAFNKFYQRKDSAGRIDKIISDNAKLSAARMALVEAVRLVVHEGLYLLGLQAPDEM